MWRVVVAGIIICLGAWVVPCQGQQSASQDTGILIITGDLARPYQIVNGAVWVQEVTVNELRTTQGQWEAALRKVLQTAKEEIQKSGANALINARLEFVSRPFYIEPQRVHGGETHGLVVVYGTVVKYAHTAPQ